MNYEVIFLIPPDHQDYIAEIMIDGQFVGRISQESGQALRTFDFYQGDQEELVAHRLSIVEAAIAAAKDGLNVRAARVRDAK